MTRKRFTPEQIVGDAPDGFMEFGPLGFSGVVHWWILCNYDEKVSAGVLIPKVLPG